MKTIKIYLDNNFKYITIIAFITFVKIINYTFPSTSIDNFIIPEKIDSVLYEISIGYIISYIFYIIVEFIPNTMDKLKKEKEIIPLRVMVYREIQIWLSGVLTVLFTIIPEQTENKDYTNINDFLTYSKLTNAFRIKKSVEGAKFNFNEYIYTESKRIQNSGNNIMQRYINYLSNELNYDIFYIVSECPLFFYFPNSYKVMSDFFENYNMPLSAYCTGYKENLNKTINHVINIYEWAQREYQELIQNADNTNIELYPVDFKKFIVMEDDNK